MADVINYTPTVDISDINDEIWFDIINRTITPKNPESLKEALVQNDANSRNLSFMMQRYFENEDLSKKKIRVHYINSLNMHDIGDTHSLEIMADNQNVISFKWLISKKVCLEAGTLKFSIEFYDDDGYELYSKPTTININEGICTHGEIPEPDDWYLAFKKDMANMQQQIEEIESIKGVYVGSGEMPENCNVQIDPTGEVIDLNIYATKEYVNKSISDINNTLNGLEARLASI